MIGESIKKIKNYKIKKINKSMSDKERKTKKRIQEKNLLKN